MAGGHGGKRKGAGRKPEALTLVTRQLKETILHALEASHKDGGLGYLTDVAKKDHKTFCALLGRVLPMTVNGEGDNGEIETVTTIKIVGVSSGSRD